MGNFQLSSEFTPKGDQPQAIEELIKGFTEEGKTCQTLLGVTGSGKTFTMANVIAALDRPTLVFSHNKTLAAQLYSEFREFFPENAVGYFVSYYDYYQPEAYIPQRDLYIEKDASINEDIDRLRLAATSEIMSREDVIIVASVSCIYGLGSPEDYKEMFVYLRKGEQVDRDEIISRLVAIHYERHDFEFGRGRFRVRGDVLEVYPSYAETAYRIEFFGDEIDRLCVIDALTRDVQAECDDLSIFPAKHFVLPEGRIEGAIDSIKLELEQRIEQLRGQGKLLEAQRLEARTRYDMELMQEIGYCPGIENYSRHLSGRAPGEPPYTLIDYFPDDFFMIVDESHASIPQLRGMYHHDLTRKNNLIEHGFRLPSALDNRPLKFEEWEGKIHQALFVSATPGPYELEKCGGEVAEQIIRPTGLVDPIIHVRPASGQVDDLLKEVKKRVEKKERVLITTLTMRMAEDLSDFLKRDGLKCAYLHSEINALDRVQILKDLRLGKHDVIVGVNLLREGLDLPEVSLVCILDADKEGFLRSDTSLIQTIGRTARNVNAEVILYADVVTQSMKRAIDETNRRREIQVGYNEEHHITPQTIRKAVRDGIEQEIAQRSYAREVVAESEEEYITQEFINELEEEMRAAAEDLEFERAAALRDRILQIREEMGISRTEGLATMVKAKPGAKRKE
ncbi:MAG: excinuclease ABC subunit UvrB [Planctomycetes bacterium]|nr:excinuclease ABC subunit UvrB [Planctomycetota bacterium]